MSGAYYNEINSFAAAWLRELIKDGLIAPGDVDERRITDVEPDDLVGYTQCHFFAGIGGWSAALRLAGWEDDRPVWTGSCPCQPFSLAGKRDGFRDERHLWPVWYGLIAERRPPVVFAEQVASATDWIAVVRRDLETVGYAVGACPIEAACVGALHRRDRFWLVADAEWDQQPRPESRHGPAGRMGGGEQPVAWHADWEGALCEFRAVDDGTTYGVEACDAPRNAIVPAVAAAFVSAYLLTRSGDGVPVDEWTGPEGHQ